MKLVLANNQSEKFVSFYKDLQTKSPTPFDYSGYVDLLFVFDNDAQNPVTVMNLATGKQLNEYDGIYINGYLSTYELAVTLATCADAAGVPYVNREMRNAPSLSKLSTYAKLVAGGVRIPKTVAGSKNAIAQAQEYAQQISFPAILKRADADRGIDNFKVKSFDEALTLLTDHDERSIWILQEFVDNDGFYLVSFYDSKPAFCIFRSLEERPDGDELKAHMFKPKGGANASMIPLEEVEPAILDECQRALDISNRQIGSVDCIFEPSTKKVYVLEVNYNPQLVTIETLKEVRIDAFLNNLKNVK